MDHYVVYVDETGAFSCIDRPAKCFVGGFVCRATGDQPALEEELAGMLRESV